MRSITDTGMRATKKCNLIFRCNDFQMNESADFREVLNWHFFNDFYSLDKRRVANVFYFHMKQEEFEEVENVCEERTGESVFGVCEPEKVQSWLEVDMREFYVGLMVFNRSLAVGVFATFVFFLPVILSFFG